MPRRAHSLLAVSLLACAEPASDEASTSTSTSTSSETGSSETGSATSETGTPASFCGDGVVDAGEACDDANGEDDDGCLSTCELGPCAFEWTTRELVMSGSEFAYHLPLVVEADDLVTAPQLGAGGLGTVLVRSHRADGLAYASNELSFMGGPPEVHALLGTPEGDLLLARAGAGASAEIHRLDADGNVLWSRSRASTDTILDLQWSSVGELVLVNTISNDPMDAQVELAALDPSSGDELWAHELGGPVAANGYSIDHGAALALDANDRAFVGMDQYDDWDTISPVVVAFAPADDPTPLWSTKLLESPGDVFAIRDVVVNAQGDVAASFQREGGTQKFYIAHLDGETGELLWLRERDDFGLPNELSAIRGLALTDDRVFATGSWKLTIEGTDVIQAYVLGLDLGGQLACLATLDDYQGNTSVDNFLPMDLRADAGELYLSGYVYRRTSGDVDLLLAEIRP